MSCKASKYDNYFTKLDRSDKLNQWQCNLCSYKTPAASHTSTSTRSNHLKDKHEKALNELEAKTKEKQKAAKRKAEKPQENPGPSKQMKIDDGMFFAKLGKSM